MHDLITLSSMIDSSTFTSYSGACATGVSSCSNGMCTCTAGYTGPDCCQCALGYYKSTDGTCKRKDSY